MAFYRAAAVKGGEVLPNATLAIVRRKWVGVAIIALTAVAGAGLFYWRRHWPDTPRRTVTSAPAPALPSQITVTGKIRAAHVTGTGSDAMGAIDAFEANVGDEVFQGQVLAEVGSAALESERSGAAAAVEKAQNRVEDTQKAVNMAQLDASRANADRESARAELDRVTKLLDRQKTLLAAGATPRLTYERTERDWESAREQWDAQDKVARAARGRVEDTLKEAGNANRILADKRQQLEAVRSAMESAVVQSPVDGLVVGRQGAVGDPVERFGNDLFSIATDLYDLEVAVEAKPDVVKRLRPSVPALVIIPDLQDSTFPGVVKTIEGSQVVIGFQSSTPAVRPGMPAEVRLKPALE
jgi:multidrug efflux pump subunit AcrA (membrane-fusion protein)